jgi:yeast amino acid transporter
MKVQGYSIDDLPFQAILGVYGSYIGLIMNVFCILAQLFVSISPISGPINANDFFQNMLAVPIILILFFVWKVAKRTSFVRASEIDLLSGRRELDLAALKREELAERQTWSIFKK